MATFKQAAYDVLKEVKHPLESQEIADIAVQKGYVSSNGKTPEATMSAQIYTDIQENPKSKFVKLRPNLFGLVEWDHVLAYQSLNIIRRAAKDIVLGNY